MRFAVCGVRLCRPQQPLHAAAGAGVIAVIVAVCGCGCGGDSRSSPANVCFGFAAAEFADCELSYGVGGSTFDN